MNPTMTEDKSSLVVEYWVICPQRSARLQDEIISVIEAEGYTIDPILVRSTYPGGSIIRYLDFIIFNSIKPPLTLHQ